MLHVNKQSLSNPLPLENIFMGRSTILKKKQNYQ